MRYEVTVEWHDGTGLERRFAIRAKAHTFYHNQKVLCLAKKAKGDVGAVITMNDLQTGRSLKSLEV